MFKQKLIQISHNHVSFCLKHQLFANDTLLISLQKIEFHKNRLSRHHKIRSVVM